jgi:hypothetical protein
MAGENSLNGVGAKVISKTADHGFWLFCFAINVASKNGFFNIYRHMIPSMVPKGGIPIFIHAKSFNIFLLKDLYKIQAV